MGKYFLIGFTLLCIQPHSQAMEPEINRIDIQIKNMTTVPIEIMLKTNHANKPMGPSDTNLLKHAEANASEWYSLNKRVLPNGTFDITNFERNNILRAIQIAKDQIKTTGNEITLDTSNAFKAPGTKIFHIEFKPMSYTESYYKNPELMAHIYSSNPLPLKELQKIEEGQVKKTEEYEEIMELINKVGAWRRVSDLVKDETKNTINEQDIYDALGIHMQKNLDPKERAEALFDPKIIGLNATEPWLEVYKRLIKIFHSDFFRKKSATSLRKATAVTQIINNAKEAIQGEKKFESIEPL